MTTAYHHHRPIDLLAEPGSIFLFEDVASPDAKVVVLVRCDGNLWSAIVDGEYDPVPQWRPYRKIHNDSGYTRLT